MDTHSAYLAIGALPLFLRRKLFGIVFFEAIPAIAIALVANWRFAGATMRRLTTGALALYLVGVAITGTGNGPSTTTSPK